MEFDVQEKHIVEITKNTKKSPILILGDAQTGETKIEPTSRYAAEGVGVTINPSARGKTKTIFENEPDTQVSGVILTNEGNIILRVVEQGAKKARHDYTEEDKQRVLQGYSPDKIYKKEKISYREPDNAQLTSLSSIFGGETAADFVNGVKDIVGKFKKPTIQTMTPSGAASTKQFEGERLSGRNQGKKQTENVFKGKVDTSKMSREEKFEYYKNLKTK